MEYPSSYDEKCRAAGERNACRAIDGSRKAFREPSKNFHVIIAYLVLVLISAGGVSSCSLERLTTKSPGAGDQPQGAQANNQNSNVGSLQAVADSLNKVSIIRPGDQLQITVWGYPSFNTTTAVNEYGTISVPLVGQMLVAGLTENQFSEQLKQRLSEYIKGEVKLTISHIGMEQRVSVLGAVSKQGNYPALTEMSLVEVLAEAGGATSTADLRHIKIYRAGIRSDVVEVDLSEYLRSGNMQYIPKVGAGDTIFVPEQQDFVRDFSAYAGEVVLLFGFFTLLR